MIPGITWVTGDAIQLASSAGLWPHVNPRPPPEDHETYSNMQHVSNAYADFYWMGEADNLNNEDNDPNDMRQRRMAQVGTGTLRDA